MNIVKEFSIKKACIAKKFFSNKKIKITRNNRVIKLNRRQKNLYLVLYLMNLTENW